MEKETTEIIPKQNFNKKKTKYFRKNLLIFMIFVVNITFILINIGINNRKINNYRKEINYKINNFENILKNYYKFDNIHDKEQDMIKNEEFNDNIKKYYEQLQANFCSNSYDFINKEIENLIEEALVNFNNLTYNIFVYKENDIISKSIKNNGVWNENVTYNLISSMDYFTKKKNLSIESVYFIDIGANIGWYSFYLGYLGYQILSFEPSKFNNYILKKNFCLNRNVNITIINKSFSIQKKNCFLVHKVVNISDSAVICNKNISIYNKKYYIEEITLTKLNTYISFLSNKNIGLIAFDLNGAEEKAIISGQALIVKYHIPFIYMKFMPKLLENQSTNIKKFLGFFESNNYKFSIVNFLSKKYISINELLKKDGVNLYIIYSDFLK